MDPKDRRTFILILYVLKELSQIDQTKLIMTSALTLNEGSHVPLSAACCLDVVFCVPAEGCGATCTCCVTSHCVTASEDLKYDVKVVALA